ncbi:hypothetical protein CISIN_1g036451mg, partial [Citrus sinensis]
GFRVQHSSLVEKMKAETQDFFNLPIEKKNKYWQRPGDIEGFGGTLEIFLTEVECLSLKMLDQMAKALRMDPNEMKEMNYYPPCLQPNQVISLNSHSDASALTIRLQINEMNGIQTKKDGKWVLILTNGIYCNIEHCATINSMKERLSFATFCNPKLDGEFGPTPNLITPESPSLFKRINVVDHLKELFSIEL